MYRGGGKGSDNNVRTHVGGYIIMYQGVPQGFTKCTENVPYRGHPPPLVHYLREGGCSELDELVDFDAPDRKEVIFWTSRGICKLGVG